MSSAAYRIRPAGFEDAEGIFNLIKSFPLELIPRPIHDIVENIDRFFVCDLDGHVEGTASWQILPEIGKPRSPSVEVKSVAVSPAVQRLGIGKALVTTVVDHIIGLHPAQILVLTFQPEFFRSLGFQETPKEALMHKLYAGCINCTKYDSPFTCPEIAMALDPRTWKLTRRPAQGAVSGP